MHFSPLIMAPTGSVAAEMHLYRITCRSAMRRALEADDVQARHAKADEVQAPAIDLVRVDHAPLWWRALVADDA